MGGRRMRYPASERLEIIRTVGNLSPAGKKWTLAMLSASSSTFYDQCAQ
jgi:hypothetical protein